MKMRTKSPHPFYSPLPEGEGIGVRVVFSFLFFIIICHLSFAFAAGLSDINVTPLRTEWGARPLALGGAYVAIADDPNAAFYNPGGLPWASGMAAMVDQNASNIIASQAYPTGHSSTLGLAIISSRISDIPLPAGSLSATSGNTLVFSFGHKFSEKFGLGINIKYLLSQIIQRTGQSDQSATGWNSDLGLLWKAREWVTVGLTGVNLYGTNLDWSSGRETVNAAVRVGVAAKVAGDVNSPIYLEDKKLLLSSELELQQGRTFYKLGGEYAIGGKIFLRGGYASSAGALDLGLGWRWEGWGIDLTSAVEETKNERRTYLSLLYFPQEWIFIRKEIPPWAVSLQEISLRDNLVTYEEKSDVTGKVEPGVEVLINSTLVYVKADGTFQAQVPLLSGKNLILVEVRYKEDQQIYRYRVLRKAKVVIAEEKKIEKELEKAATAQEKSRLEEKKKQISERKEKVETLVTMGVVEVRPEAEFELEGRVTRGELATWLVRAAGIPITSVTKDVFKDVPKGHPQAFYIKAVTDLNLMAPYSDGTFRPNQAVSETEGREIFRRFGIIR